MEKLMQPLETGHVLIRRRGADRIRRGHIWVYRSDILEAEHAERGAIVTVREERGGIVGAAFYSSTSQIALRFLTRGAQSVDEEFIRARFSAASEMRARLDIDRRLSRRIYSEGDFLPGLIVDRYEDCLVVQSLIQATDRLRPIITTILQEEYEPRSILFRNDSRVRELEDLPLVEEWAGERPPETIIVNEDGKQLEVPLLGGQKTGAYLDQRENHRAARRYAHGNALDGFSYGGAFALQLAERCETVEAVDISADAVSLVRSNASRNGLFNVKAIEANVFDYLRQQFAEKARYDIIVLDPPAFAKSKENVEAALRGYREINNRAMRLLKDGGILITCTCSHHISEALFAEMLAGAANDAGRWARVLERRVQSPDHPILLTVPETLYLKCFVLELRH
jgi:23S rRNA (cytosine1962-C5)-methyltransferase